MHLEEKKGKNKFENNSGCMSDEKEVEMKFV